MEGSLSYSKNLELLEQIIVYGGVQAFLSV
jgi:hypothetical protein